MTISDNLIIELNNLTFAYPTGAVILQDFSWQVERGRSWAVIGPSGCGKSTLLYLLAGLKQPGGGRLLVDGRPLIRPRPQTGLILQDYGLLPWATVWDNAALGLKIRAFYGPDGKHAPADAPVPDREERVAYWLDRLGIGHIAGQYPGQISGGQRQRTAIARTLALDPDLLLMDEPFGALDALTREASQRLILELSAERGLTTLIVTHSIDEAVFMGQKILVLTRPPTTETLVVDNPGAGAPGYLQEPAFLEQGRRLRRMLGPEK